MKIGIFQQLQHTKESMDVGFDTFLYTYHYNSIDPFVFIAKNFDLNTDIKYMVAVRAHVISPQYLFKILQSFYYLNNDTLNTENIKPIPVYINLIPGAINDERQQQYGGTIQNINDNSTFEERSNHLIEFIASFNEINSKHFNNFFHANFYITTTNKYIFNEAVKNNNKIIIEYTDYKDKTFDIEDTSNVIITLGPVIRDTQEELDLIDKTPSDSIKPNTVFCTPKELKQMLKKFEEDKIEEVLFWGLSTQDIDNIYNFTREYKGSIK
jgi:hypothetical protein